MELPPETVYITIKENEKDNCGVGGEFLSINDFAELMRDFQQENPKVQFNILSGMTSTIKDNTESSILDFGLLIEPVDISKYEFLRLQQRER